MKTITKGIQKKNFCTNWIRLNIETGSKFINKKTFRKQDSQIWFCTFLRQQNSCWDPLEQYSACLENAFQRREKSFLCSSTRRILLENVGKLRDFELEVRNKIWTALYFGQLTGKGQNQHGRHNLLITYLARLKSRRNRKIRQGNQFLNINTDYKSDPLAKKLMGMTFDTRIKRIYHSVIMATIRFKGLSGERLRPP